MHVKCAKDSCVFPFFAHCMWLWFLNEYAHMADVGVIALFFPLSSSSCFITIKYFEIDFPFPFETLLLKLQCYQVVYSSNIIKNSSCLENFVNYPKKWNHAMLHPKKTQKWSFLWEFQSMSLFEQNTNFYMHKLHSLFSQFYSHFQMNLCNLMLTSMPYCRVTFS